MQVPALTPTRPRLACPSPPQPGPGPGSVLWSGPLSSVDSGVWCGTEECFQGWP